VSDSEEEPYSSPDTTLQYPGRLKTPTGNGKTAAAAVSASTSAKVPCLDNLPTIQILLNQFTSIREVTAVLHSKLAEGQLTDLVLTRAATTTRVSSRVDVQRHLRVHRPLSMGPCG
jgi:hypothetical protein